MKKSADLNIRDPSPIAPPNTLVPFSAKEPCRYTLGAPLSWITLPVIVQISKVLSIEFALCNLILY